MCIAYHPIIPKIEISIKATRINIANWKNLKDLEDLQINFNGDFIVFEFQRDKYYSLEEYYSKVKELKNQLSLEN